MVTSDDAFDMATQQFHATFKAALSTRDNATSMPSSERTDVSSSSLADEMPTANFSHVQPTSDILLKMLTGTPLSLAY